MLAWSKIGGLRIVLRRWGFGGAIGVVEILAGQC